MTRELDKPDYKDAGAGGAGTEHNYQRGVDTVELDVLIMLAL